MRQAQVNLPHEAFFTAVGTPLTDGRTEALLVLVAAAGFGLLSALGFPVMSRYIPAGEAGAYTAVYFSVRSIAGVIALGAADRLVARTDYDDQPAVAHLPTVGGGLTPGVEWLAAREPDLVFAWPDAPSRSLVARLEALGIPVYTAPSETIGEALDVAADVGALLALEPVARTGSLTTATTMGVKIRQTVSLTSSADIAPDRATSAHNSCLGERARDTTHHAA